MKNKEITNLTYIKETFSLLFIFICFHLNGQVDSFQKGNEYIIDEITVKGLKTFNEQTVITYTGLRKGQKVRIPGEEISAIINKLWKLDLFSDINFYLKKIDGENASIEIFIEELPTLSDFKITGLKKSKVETIVSDTEIKKGKKLTQNFIKTTRNYIINKFKKDGFLNTKVNINIEPDSTEQNIVRCLLKLIEVIELKKKK